MKITGLYVYDMSIILYDYEFSVNYDSIDTGDIFDVNK